MKNTLILNVTSSTAKLEHISNVADGTDRLILEIKNGGGDSIHIVNALGSIDVTTTSELDYIEVPRCYWTGLGAESIYIYKGDGLVYTIAINKIQVCGGSYQLEKLSEDTETDTLTIYFRKANKLQNGDYRFANTQVIGTWTDGKPIYRTVLGTGSRQATTSNMNVSALDMDVLLRMDALGCDGTVDNYQAAVKKWFFSGVSGINSRQVWLNGNTLNITASNFTFSTFFVFLEYTRKSDPARDPAVVEREESELRDEFMLVWEGDVAADQNIVLPESMMAHKEIAFLLSNAAVTASGDRSLWRFPTDIFKAYANKNDSPTRYFQCCDYDNRWSHISYVDDVTVYLDYNNLRVQKIWYVD